MARGPRFWALGVDSGPRGGAFEGIVAVFVVWAAPGGSTTIQKCGGRNPLHFWMVLKPPGAAQTPKTDPKNPARLPSGAQCWSEQRELKFEIAE